MAKKTKNIEYYEAIGRRKSAVARVRLYIPVKEKTVTVGTIKIKAGEIFLNRKPLAQTITLERDRNYIVLPLNLTSNLDRFAISIITSGGGRSSTLDAMVHGISRALEICDKETYRPILKKQGLLKRDPRKKERRKVGTGGKARRLKQSPKR